ncbi:MAG: NERD domain-containing protein [Gammaproteobacteria bacterium]|nr:NERD domain-containing protein [Gammaproteobacteria bacterium]
MTESLQNLIQMLALSTGQLYAILGALATVATLAVLFRKQLGHWREERQVARMIRRLGARHLRNLLLPDGMGGEVTIEHLLLTRDALLVIGVKRFSGLIFGGPQTDQWTQVINRVSYKFPNPDGYLQRQVNAVHMLAPGATVTGLHLFTHGASFPKDKPDNVKSTREIGQLPKRLKHSDIPKGMRMAWEQLVDSIQK